MNLFALSKVLLEGLAVALAAYFIPRKTTGLQSILLIALTAAAVFSVLDFFAPEIGISARQGAGFGIGLNTVGWSSQVGGFEDCKFTCSNNPNKCKLPGPCQRSSVGGGGSNLTLECMDLNSLHSDNSAICKRSPMNWDNCSDVSTECKQLRGLGTDWSQTNVGSRRMNFPESGCPVNTNIQDYKLVPGLYSKYVLQSGYNQNVGTYNELDEANLATV